MMGKSFVVLTMNSIERSFLFVNGLFRTFVLFALSNKKLLLRNLHISSFKIARAVVGARIPVSTRSSNSGMSSVSFL